MAFWEGGPHETDGLAGYPARDFGAPGGAPVFAWDTLRVTRISGSSGARGTGFGGYNLYLEDATGRSYFVTHLEGLRVKVGQTIRPGTAIARVGDYRDENGMATHVHIGYTGGDPTSTLGLKPEWVFTQTGATVGSAYVDARLKALGKAPSGGHSGPLAGVPVLGPAGRATTRGLDWLLAPVDKTIGVVEAPFNALEWAGSNWDRVLEVLGGVVLVIIGLVIMGRSLGVTKTKVEIAGAVGAYQGRREAPAEA